MQVERTGREIRFQGVLDENSDIEVLKYELSLAAQESLQANQEGVVVDFSGVARANSCGILHWLQAIRSFPARLIYVNVPVWLVEQMNCIKEFSEGNIRIATIQAPFYCQMTDQTEVVMLEVGRDVPLLNDYTGFQLSRTNANNSEIDPDFEPDEYFVFLTRAVNEGNG